MSIFALARYPTPEFVEPPDPAPIFKQFGDYRCYPYTEMALPRSSPARGRDTTASAFPISRWAELPCVA